MVSTYKITLAFQSCCGYGLVSESKAPVACQPLVPITAETGKRAVNDPGVGQAETELAYN